MIVSINQPAYLPWLGYFHRIAVADAHIVLDHVQFEKNSFTNRNKVRLSAGWCWLTVPLRTAGKFGDLSIHELEIAIRETLGFQALGNVATELFARAILRPARWLFSRCLHSHMA
jgi:hypothetical protein